MCLWELLLTATSVSITVETLKEMGKLDTKVGQYHSGGGADRRCTWADCTDCCQQFGRRPGEYFAGFGKDYPLLRISGVVGLGAKRFFCWFHGAWIMDVTAAAIRYWAFVLCLVMAYCAEEFFGVADITGAYVAGLVISCTPRPLIFNLNSSRSVSCC